MSEREDRFMRRLRENASDTPNATPSWAGYLSSLRADAERLGPASWREWSMVKQALVSAQASPSWLARLKRLPGWHERWLPVVRSGLKPIGNLPGHPSALRHAYEASVIEEMVGITVGDIELVVEFGGGFGDMCRVFHGLGFCGQYVIYDFVEVLALQEYVLASWGIPTRWQQPVDGPGVCLCSEVKSLASAQGGLFLASFSISEAPLETRDVFLPVIRAQDFFFVNYQTNFRGIDNEAWVEKLKRSMPDVEWERRSSERTLDNWFLLGVKRP